MAFLLHIKLSMKNIHYNLLYLNYRYVISSQSEIFFYTAEYLLYETNIIKKNIEAPREVRVSVETSTQSLCKIILNETERFPKWKEIRGVMFHAPISRWFQDRYVVSGEIFSPSFFFFSKIEWEFYCTTYVRSISISFSCYFFFSRGNKRNGGVFDFSRQWNKLAVLIKFLAIWQVNGRLRHQTRNKTLRSRLNCIVLHFIISGKRSCLESQELSDLWNV